MKISKPALLIFTLSLIIFLVSRLINLDKIPVFVDEAIYVRWSQVMKAEATLRFLPLSDGKQPLSMWLTIPLLKFVPDPLLAGRLVSVFAGLGTLVGVSLLSYLLFSSPIVASLSALIYAVLPFTMFFDRMALADSLLAMFGTWTLALGTFFFKTKRLDIAMLTGFCLGGGLLTKSPAIFFYLWLLALGLFLVSLSDLKTHFKKIILGVLAIILISQGMYSILRLGPGFGMIGSRNQDYVFKLSEIFFHPLNPFIGNMKTTVNWLWLLLTPPLLFTLPLSFWGKRKKESLLLFTVSIMPLVAQALIAKVYTSRYILFAIPPFIPLMSEGVLWLWNRKGTLLRLLPILSIAVPIIVTSVYLLSPQSAPMSIDMRSGYLEEWTAGWGQKEIAKFLINEESKGEKIVVFTEGFFGTLPDGLQIYTEGHKNITIVGSPPQVNRLPDGLVNSSKENKNYLILNKSRNFLSSEDLKKLTLIVEYPKAVRSNGSREYLQFWQLK